MKVISYNIQFGRGLDHKFYLARVCETVKTADIICLQEVESFCSAAVMSINHRLLLSYYQNFTRSSGPVSILMTAIKPAMGVWSIGDAVMAI